MALDAESVCPLVHKTTTDPQNLVVLYDWYLEPLGEEEERRTQGQALVCVRGRCARKGENYGRKWRSSGIVERQAMDRVLTSSGREYHLQGHMSDPQTEAARRVLESIPETTRNLFTWGFPHEWKAILHRALAQEEDEIEVIVYVKKRRKGTTTYEFTKRSRKGLDKENHPPGTSRKGKSPAAVPSKGFEWSSDSLEESSSSSDEDYTSDYAPGTKRTSFLDSTSSVADEDVGNPREIGEEEEEGDGWSQQEVEALLRARKSVSPLSQRYWEEIAAHVPGRTAPECARKYYRLHKGQQGPRNTALREGEDEDGDEPLITARTGTLKHDQQVRRWLEKANKGHTDDVFTSDLLRQSQRQDSSQDMLDVDNLLAEERNSLSLSPCHCPSLLSGGGDSSPELSILRPVDRAQTLRYMHTLKARVGRGLNKINSMPERRPQATQSYCVTDTTETRITSTLQSLGKQRAQREEEEDGDPDEEIDFYFEEDEEDTL